MSTTIISVTNSRWIIQVWRQKYGLLIASREYFIARVGLIVKKIKLPLLLLTNGIKMCGFDTVACVLMIFTSLNKKYKSRYQMWCFLLGCAFFNNLGLISLEIYINNDIYVMSTSSSVSGSNITRIPFK